MNGVRFWRYLTNETYDTKLQTVGERVYLIMWTLTMYLYTAGMSSELLGLFLLKQFNLN